MDPKIYAKFLLFVQEVNEQERANLNRRMRSVFLWCFLIPVVVVALLVLGVNFRIFPPIFKSYQDWILLFFPVAYSIYFLSSQVLTGIPSVIKKGALASSMGQLSQESEWRAKIAQAMAVELKFNGPQWSWVITNLEEDLERMQIRNRYLTALAGAVFYLLMEGIDSFTGNTGVGVISDQLGMTTSNQWVGLALFLLLLYLSGQQNIQTLRRFQSCAKMVRLGFFS